MSSGSPLIFGMTEYNCHDHFDLPIRMSSGSPLTLRMRLNMSVITVDLTTFIVCRGRKREDKHLDDDDDVNDDDDDDDNDEDDDDVNRRPPSLPLRMPRVNIIFVSFF